MLSFGHVLSTFSLMDSHNIRSIAVFIGSEHASTPDIKDAVQDLADYMIEKDLTLIYGGSDLGMMGMLAEQLLEAGNEVIGIFPRENYRFEKPKPKLTKLLLVSSESERLCLFEHLSDAFLACPGGLGTLTEAITIWNYIMQGRLDKPLAFLNPNGFFDGLFQFLKQSHSEGLISDNSLKRPFIANCPRLLLDLICQTEPEPLVETAS